MAEEIKKERKKRSLSLIQPTSVPTLGNYLGAMRGWKDFQDDFDTVFGIADLHSITVRQEYPLYSVARASAFSACLDS